MNIGEREHLLAVSALLQQACNGLYSGQRMVGTQRVMDTARASVEAALERLDRVLDGSGL